MATVDPRIQKIQAIISNYHRQLAEFQKGIPINKKRERQLQEARELGVPASQCALFIATNGLAPEA